MPHRLAAPTAVLLAAPCLAALCLAGCGATSDSTTPATTAAPTSPTTNPATSPPTNPPTNPGASEVPRSAPGTATSTGCAGDALAEGTWSGPVTAVVRGRGARTEFTSSPGRGTLDLVVSGGRVTGGHWSVRWHSTGSARTANATATLSVDGTLAGRTSGTAGTPQLTGTWRLQGEARITEPVRSSAPVDETGPATATLRVRSADCDAATATFRTSFTSKDTQASFRASATWTGRRS